MQTQDKQPQPQPRPREFRFADTIDYIGRYTAELLKMKAQGKSNGEMLAYLRTRRIQANLGDIVEFWKSQEQQKQKPQQQKQKQQPGQQRQEQQQNQHRHGSPPQNAGGGTTAAAPARNQAPNKSGSESEVETANTPNAEEHPHGGLPMAGGCLTAQHCADLFRMRAEGKKTEDLLSYLQSIGVQTTFSDLLRTMNIYREWLAEKEQEMERTEQNAKMPGDDASATPEFRENQGEAAPEQEAAERQDQETEGEDRPPLAGENASANRASEAARLMVRFERILDQKFDDYDVGEDRSSANLKDINMMMRTVMSYEKDQARQEYRNELLKIKKADHELRAKKAEQAEARQKAADNNGYAEDFDNTEDIAHMHKESFRDVDEYLASGEVDDKIAEARRKAKAAGAEVEEYVPPPLGTGLWTKPAPSPAPGVPSAQAAPSGKAQRAATEASATTDPSGKAQRATTDPGTTTPIPSG